MRRRMQRATGLWEVRVRDYLTFRNRLGFSLRTAGEELVLFARYLDDTRHCGPLTTTVAVQWAKLTAVAKPQYWAWRLNAVRGFAKHLAAIDSRHEVPPTGMLGPAYTRRQPYIYTADEINALIEQTRTVKPINSLPPHTFRTFFGLLAVTGMRCGEALSLRREHVDLTEGLLTIAKAKLGKSRALPLHGSTVDALRAYAERRDATFPRRRKSDAFFLSRRGTALSYQRVTNTFRDLRRQLDWHGPPLPRVHDLRHTFAVCNLLRWCESGEDVDGKIISLTTYLGHVHVTCTYWYFTAVPELMAFSCKRFEEYARAGGGQ